MSRIPRVPIICLRVCEGLAGFINMIFSAYIVNWHLSGDHGRIPPTVDLILIASILSMFIIIFIDVSISYIFGFMFFAVVNSDVAFCNGPVCMAGRGSAVLSAVQFSAWGASALITLQEMVKERAIKREERGQFVYDSPARAFGLA
ncbi:hypothetical protein PT974_00195 [Cladobotryum mycophilum]|uniref:MARVEL domain-containing protein n=1 Tax=Cladobotryum mycophilum TaxID=491253 RepID=A0ABR0T112_9HYPO